MGVALNICSKNDPTIGLTGFDHPSSELKPDDFIVKKVNWENKDRNIHEIAGEINIGEDAIVFIDDNPAERQIVADNAKCQVLPYELPDNAVQILDRSGFFESLGVFDEDKKRTERLKKFEELLELENKKRKYTLMKRGLTLVKEDKIEAWLEYVDKNTDDEIDASKVEALVSVMEKLEENSKKYPVSKSKGNSKKYSGLPRKKWKIHKQKSAFKSCKAWSKSF